MTPGAERAARKVIDGCIDGASNLDYSVNAEIISRETHDAEMLEALKELVQAEWMVSPDWAGGEKRNKAISKAEALIAEVEAQ